MALTIIDKRLIQAHFILAPNILQIHMNLNPLCSQSGVLDDLDNHHSPIQQVKSNTTVR